MKKVLLLTVPAFILLVQDSYSQGGPDSVLSYIEKNNKSLQSNKKYGEARKAEFKTGLTPYDPQVEYDYLWGLPVGAGNQKDFSVTQRFDFPAAYKRKQTLSGQQITHAEIQHQIFRQDILLQAKLILLDCIYTNKKQAVFDERRIRTEQLVQNYQKKLKQGEVIILDVNKAKLELLNIRQESSLNQNAVQTLKTKLSELNGGFDLDIRDTLYPIVPVISDFETLDSTIEANDPIIKLYEQEKILLRQQIAVQRALNLPKIETGYHSQGILGQNYRGIHAGITIPLWENKNKLKAAQANLNYVIQYSSAQRLEHRFENKQLYDQLAVRLNAIQEYQRLIGELRNNELLDKALSFGQITIIDYFKDQAYYYTSYDKFLQLEREYHKAIAELYKFKL
ncbi:MAG: TolC family protein [Chitinophagaceae bacterium]